MLNIKNLGRMKGKILHTSAFLILLLFASTGWAQEWITGMDIYSSYIWRGSKFGSGPAFQPSVEFSAGSFNLGGWGSVNASTSEAAETDLYAEYSVGLGEKTSLGLTLTDYYFPGTSWLKKNSHFIEPMVNLGIGSFSLTGAYMMNGGEGDVYLEAGFSAGAVDLFLGSGDGAYTRNRKFNVCNVGITTTKEIKITDSFSLPVSGSVIFNPSTEQAYIVAGISL
jgi:hypothetical protein